MSDSVALTETLKLILKDIFENISVVHMINLTFDTILEQQQIRLKINEHILNFKFSLTSQDINNKIEEAIQELRSQYELIKNVFINPVENMLSETIHFDSEVMDDILRDAKGSLMKSAMDYQMALPFSYYEPHQIHLKLCSIVKYYQDRNEKNGRKQIEIVRAIDSSIHHYSQMTEFLLGDYYFDPEKMAQIHHQVYQESLDMLERAYFNSRMLPEQLAIKLQPFKSTFFKRNEENREQIEGKVSNVIEEQIEMLRQIMTSQFSDLDQFELVYFESHQRAEDLFNDETVQIGGSVVEGGRVRMRTMMDELYKKKKMELELELEEKRRSEEEAREAERRQREEGRKKRLIEEANRKQLEEEEKLKNKFQILEQQNKLNDFKEKAMRIEDQCSSIGASADKRIPVMDQKPKATSQRKPQNCKSPTSQLTKGCTISGDNGDDYGTSTWTGAVGGMETNGRSCGLDETAVAIHIGLSETKLGITNADGNFQVLSNMKNIIDFDGGTKLDFSNFLMRYEVDRIYQVNTKNDKEWELKDFRIEELISFLLAQLKWSAESQLGKSIVDCLIVVPQSLNKCQRKAIEDAGKLAGFTAVNLINDTHAMAMAYLLVHMENEHQMVNQVICGNIYERFLDVTCFALGDGNALSQMGTSGHFFSQPEQELGWLEKILGYFRSPMDDLDGEAKLILNSPALNTRQEEVVTILCSPPDLFERLKSFAPCPQRTIRVDSDYPLMGASFLLRIADFGEENRVYLNWLRITEGLVDFNEFHSELLKGYPHIEQRSSNLISGVNLTDSELESKCTNYYLKDKFKVQNAKLKLQQKINTVDQLNVLSARRWQGESIGNILQRARHIISRNDEPVNAMLVEISQMVQMLQDIRANVSQTF